MKICGCLTCRTNGERNPYEDFELYCSTRELETKAIFDSIIENSFSIGEMQELHEIIEPKSKVVESISQYGYQPWMRFCRAMGPELWMGF